MKILITLHPGYGLGDAVQMSAVLRHVAKYRPDWVVDYGAEEGKHQVGRGIVANTFALGPGQVHPSENYDAEVQLLLFGNFPGWSDRPNTRVASCLHERLGMGWDPECGRYRVDVSEGVASDIQRRLTSLVPHLYARSQRVVAVHYKGDSAPHMKDLSDSQADAICDVIIELGCVPLLLDWRNVSPVANRRDVGTTGRFYLSREWGRNAEYNCAIIRRCAAFIGIDSGPGKCASATETPSLIVWTGHHPAQFHDPAPNTTHLVPVGYHNMQPICGDTGVIRWFEANYRTIPYRDNMTGLIKEWLEETLR